MTLMLKRLGYQKMDRMARETRHNFWRETYRHAWYRRVLGTSLSIVLAALVIWIFVVLAFSVQP